MNDYEKNKKDISKSLLMGVNAELDEEGTSTIGSLQSRHLEWISSWLAGEGFAKLPDSPSKGDTSVDWDIDHNLPMYTVEFLKRLPIYVDGFRVRDPRHGDMAYFHPNDVEIVMAGPGGARNTFAQPDEKPQRRKFEYTRLMLNFGAEQEAMTALGADGWELVSSTLFGPHTMVYFFKREIVE